MPDSGQPPQGKAERRSKQPTGTSQRLVREREARLEAEKRYRSIFETSLDGIITIDHLSRVTEWNESATRIFGWTRDEVLGRDIAGLIMPMRFREQHREGMRRFMETGAGPILNRRVELTALRKNGEEFPVELTVSPLRVGADTWTFSAFVRDISSRKKLEDELNWSNVHLREANENLGLAEEDLRRFNRDLERRIQERTRELEEANQDLEAFCYSVSHDLRAPLRHIDSYIQFIKEETAGALPEEVRLHFNVVAESARRMGTLIDDLLVFSRMGRQALHFEHVDMNALAGESMHELEDLVKGRKIRMLLGELPAVRGDRGMLRLVWDNLLENALKYSRVRPEAVVEVTGRRDHGECLYSVRDNGVGFDMTYVGKLFGVFQRLHSSAEFEGTGIGLANVRRIVERHGGRVWAQGEKERGATFCFALPMAGGDPS